MKNKTKLFLVLGLSLAAAAAGCKEKETAQETEQTVQRESMLDDVRALGETVEEVTPIPTATPFPETEEETSGGEAEDSSEGEYLYDINGQEVSLTFYKGEEKTKIEAPAELDGMPVTALGDLVSFEGTFYKCGAEEITVPEGITLIGNGAFLACENLKSVVLPETAEQLGTKVFYLCPSLESVTIPENVSSIGEAGISGCENLKDVYILGENTEIEEGNFELCADGLTIHAPAGSKAEDYALEHDLSFQGDAE